MAAPLITIAVPSFNQGAFLDEALGSIFSQEVAVEVFVMDAGSSDNSLAVIRKWESRLAGWRSHAGRRVFTDHGVEQMGVRLRVISNRIIDAGQR